MDRLSILFKKNTLLILVISLFPFVLKAQETVTDYDGNVYQTATIGTQVWMKENLKTTHYNDGTAWAALTTDAYCWYDNDSPTNKAIYGALYNWYTINTGKLCPTGWHVPTDVEFTSLENYLIANGYNYDGTTNGNRETNNKIAKALASTTNWAADGGTGTVGNTDYPAKRNATGFTALPGGFRNYDGTFYDVCSYSGWWCSSRIDAGSAWVRSLNYSNSYMYRDSHSVNGCGYSFRCLKDASTGVNNSKDKIQIPGEIELDQNYPNPFNPSTTIRYELSNPSQVKLSIYNLLGQKIKTLVNAFQSVGAHSIVWDATDNNNNPIGSGVYFYKLEEGTMNLQKKMILVR